MTKTYEKVKAARPIRYRIAWVVYRAIWYPFVALAVPFILINSFVGWLEWKAFPAISRTFQPLWAFFHEAVALRIGHAILGYRREPEA